MAAHMRSKAKGRWVESAYASMTQSNRQAGVQHPPVHTTYRNTPCRNISCHNTSCCNTTCQYILSIHPVVIRPVTLHLMCSVDTKPLHSLTHTLLPTLSIHPLTHPFKLSSQPALSHPVAGVFSRYQAIAHPLSPTPLTRLFTHPLTHPIAYPFTHTL